MVELELLSTGGSEYRDDITGPDGEVAPNQLCFSISFTFWIRSPMSSADLDWEMRENVEEGMLLGLGFVPGVRWTNKDAPWVRNRGVEG